MDNMSSAQPGVNSQNEKTSSVAPPSPYFPGDSQTMKSQGSTQPGVPYQLPEQPCFSEQPSGGSKVGYFALGFFLGLIGVLISYLIAKNKGEAIKSASLKFSIIGLAVCVGISVLGSIFFAYVTTAMYGLA